MGTITNLAERLWSGETSTRKFHPFSPQLALEELAPRVAFISGFANVSAVDTDEGLILLDTGGPFAAAPTMGLLRGWSRRPVHSAVYTHGHLDHVSGTPLFDADAQAQGAPPVRVVAHAAVPERFDRYLLTGGYNSCVNARQFGVAYDFPRSYRYPDLTYQKQLTLQVGGVRVELHHARGETDDHTWAWLPEQRTLCTGDLFIWASPNCGNPQKVQRYPRDWAEALRQMALLDASLLLPGHGPPIIGAARVRQALEETAELLESLCTQTLERMNAGATLDQILREVEAPAHLLERPYLRPIYDEPEFIVRNLWRLYGGWWDGDPAHLKPAPQAELSGELARLCGGAEKLASRASELAQAGQMRLACHLIELAAGAAPGDGAVKKVRAAIYRQRANDESSLMAKGIFRAAAED